MTREAGSTTTILHHCEKMEQREGVSLCSSFISTCVACSRDRGARARKGKASKPGSCSGRSCMASPLSKGTRVPPLATMVHSLWYNCRHTTLPLIAFKCMMVCLVTVHPFFLCASFTDDMPTFFIIY